MKLRKANTRDIDEILKLHNKLFDYEYSFDNYSYELDLDIATFMVLYDEEILVGYFVIHTIFEQIDILIIAVAKEYQSKGYGQFLLDYILYLKVKNNIEQLILEVAQTNKQAISFYLKNDFKQIDCRKDYYGKDKNALILERR